MLLSAFSAQAAEGMWLPEQVPAMAEALHDEGLALEGATLADPMGDPLGAVVSLGGCTAAFVSSDGLIATNAHCVQDLLAYASDAEHDYFHDGFLAVDRRKEAWGGPAAKLWITESITDVTAKMNAKIPAKLEDYQRADAIERAQSELVAACEKAPHHSCQVVGMYEGRSWRLVSRLEVSDLRVVYVPPEGVYAFGGDEDNWMWPRQCGDFALIRAWGSVDGQPAAHADDNIPYTPRKWLRIQTGGVKTGDFVMLAGYPGTTNRWRTAEEVRHAGEERYPYGVELLGDLIRTAKEAGRTDKVVARKLQATIFRYENSRKNYEGMVDNFRHSHIAERKQGMEVEMDAWIAADPRRTKAWAAGITELRALVRQELASSRRDRVFNALVGNARLLGAAWTCYRLAVERQFPDVERDPGFQARDVPQIRDRMQQIEKSLDLGADRALLKAVLQHTQTLPPDQRIPPIDAWIQANGGIDPALDAVYRSTALVAPEARLKLTEWSRADFERNADAWVKLAVALEAWQRDARAEKRTRDGAFARLRPVWMDALQQFHDDELYPDANGTLRLSFGRVEGYSPEDGVTYHAQTGLQGMARKAGGPPFDAPIRVLDQVRVAPRTRWAAPDLEDVPVNFLSTLDNTGGNSGSPTLNARGELVGFVFDRNWDAVAADWVYEADLTRSIHVDVRYLLWMLDEVEKAKVLLQEMGVGRG